MSELHFLTVSKAAALIKARKLSPVELTEAFLARIEALDPQLNTYITVTSDLARKQARRAELEITQGNYRGTLHGIPFGLKDIYDTERILTSGNSKIGVDNTGLICLSVHC